MAQNARNRQSIRLKEIVVVDLNLALLTFPQTNRKKLVCRASLLKTLWGKEKLLVTSNFSFSHSVFCPVRELSTIFLIKLKIVCKVFRVRESQRFVVCLLGKGYNLRQDSRFIKITEIA